jgi:uncharacterized protein with PIN domain
MNNKVWKVIKKEEGPEGKRCIKCKGIIKSKQNGIIRARLVTCGYSQVSGIYFNDALL